MSSLRGMLVRRLAFGAGLVVLCSGAAGFLLARSGLRRVVDQSLLHRAETFASLVVDEVPDPEDNEPGGLVFDYQGPIDELSLGLLVRISDDRGGTLAQSPEWPAQIAEAAPARPGTVTAVNLPDGRAARLATLSPFARAELPPEPGDDEPNEDRPLVESSRRITVQVLGPATLLHDTERAVLAAILSGAALSGAGVAVVVMASVRNGLVPVRRLAGALDGVNPRRPNEIAAADLPSELAPIAGGINDLLVRIRAAMAREERFTDAAAHELRTPLAELTSIASVAARHPEPERLRRGIDAAGEIASEMTELIEALLLISRRDEGYESATCSIVLAPIIGVELERHRPALAKASIDVACDAAEDACWSMPPGAARAVLRNLIDNAAEYTQGGGRIRIVVRRGHSDASIEIANGPVELRSEQIAHLFEPFWRGDLARSDRRHRGIGLAIVAEFCERAGLAAEANLTNERMLEIRIAPRA
ncbi:MAG: HAMP domain-containing histidine kinase [Phycisphaerales bacterium]|nr:HAMP domain-containing histidine kinase [Phycisphaerales bacterium]